MLKLTGGDHGGRHIKWLDRPEIRPTPARVREALFHRWREDLPDSHWWDLCSGSGVIGLEALSRGAAQVTFVEQNARALQFLKENLRTLKLSQAGQCYKSQVQKFIQRQRSIDVDFIYFDPPYDYEKLYSYVLEVLNTLPAQRPVTLCVEYRKRHKTWSLPDTWDFCETREYGDVCIDLLEKRP